MEGGQSKINTPNSHPSNPIHKAAMAAQSPWPDLKKNEKISEKPPDKETVSEKPPDEEETVSEKKLQHEINKTAIVIDVIGVVALLFMAWR